MTFLIENKTFLTLETKIKVNSQILDISGKIRQDFLERKTAFLGFINKAIKKVEKVRFFQRDWSIGQRFKNFPCFYLFK